MKSYGKLQVRALHIFSSSHPHIFSSSHLHIFSSSHLLIFTSSHSHIITFSLALLLSCPLALSLLSIYLLKARGSANETARNQLRWALYSNGLWQLATLVKDAFGHNYNFWAGPWEDSYLLGPLLMPCASHAWQARYAPWREVREEITILGPDMNSSLTNTGDFVQSKATGRRFFTDDIVLPEVQQPAVEDQVIYLPERPEAMPLRRQRTKARTPAISMFQRVHVP